MGALNGGTLHTCSGECVASSDLVGKESTDQFYFFCNCIDGCKECDEGKIYLNECPYNYVDEEIVLFKKLYTLYENGTSIYDSFIETPYVLYEYFKVYEVQLMRFQKEKSETAKRNKKMTDKIPEHLRVK